MEETLEVSEQWDESGGGFFFGVAVAVVFGAFFYALVIGGVIAWLTQN